MSVIEPIYQAVRESGESCDCGLIYEKLAREGKVALPGEGGGEACDIS